MLMFQMFHITLQSENHLIARTTPTQRVLELRVRAPKDNQAKTRPALNLALVLDRSGSMSGRKIDSVKQAAQHVIQMLSDQDRAAVVSFDDGVRVDVSSTQVGYQNRGQITERISSIQSGGSTNLSGGWSQGCQEVAAHGQGENQINRVLLLTDGLANVGITDSEILSTHARELAQRGVTTSTFGVGHGFNEHLLEAMANLGSGNFYYIADPAEIPSIFVREFTEMAAVTARNVVVTLTVPDHTSVEVLGGWRNSLEGNRLQIFLGDLASERELEIYLKLLFPPSDNSHGIVINAAASAAGLNDQDLSDETKFRYQYASAEEVSAEPVASDVLERFAKVEISDRTTAALKLERSGKNDQARKLMIESLAMNRPNMPAEQIKYYEDLAKRMEHGMAEDDRKSSQYNAYNIKRNRKDQK